MRHPIRAARFRLFDPKYLFPRYMPEDAVIVEAGAFKGQETLALARRWPRGRIHAFEPVPDNYAEAQRNTASAENVSLYNEALGDREGEVSMWVGSQSSSVLEPKEHLELFPQVEFEGRVTVPATTLAAWAERHGIDRVDGIWLDMQGYELAALQAAGPLLDRVKAIVLEASKVELYAGAPRWRDVRAWLRRQGFWVRGVRWDQTGEHGDALVVRR